MLHPPYSPDLAPSDYYLFRSLQNSLNSKTFNDDEDVKSYLVQFFDDRYQKFYERRIMKLPERWQKVIQQHGKYIIDQSSFLWVELKTRLERLQMRNFYFFLQFS